MTAIYPDMKIRPSLTLNQYQQRASTTAIYPDMGTLAGLSYCIHGLTGEAGEVAGKFKKVIRDGGGIITPERHEAIRGELGGTLWYLAMACNELGVTLEEVALENLYELAGRKVRGTLHGEGDKR